MGHTPEQGGAQTNAQNLFCFPHSCHGSCAHCRVPKGREYHSSFPAIHPPAATGPAPTSISHFSLLPLHILSQAGREFPCHTPGSPFRTGYQLYVQTEMPLFLGKVPIFSPHVYQVGQNWGFVHPQTAIIQPITQGSSTPNPPPWEHQHKYVWTECTGQSGPLPAGTWWLCFHQHWLGNLLKRPLNTRLAAARREGLWHEEVCLKCNIARDIRIRFIQMGEASGPAQRGEGSREDKASMLHWYETCIWALETTTTLHELFMKSSTFCVMPD